MGNLLVIHTREELVRSIDLGRLMQEVKTRAEGKDPSFGPEQNLWVTDH